MDPVKNAPRRKLPRWVPQAFGYALSAASLAYVLHDYDLSRIPRAIGSLEWRWVALAVVLDLAVYLMHAWRWNTLLSPVARLPFWRTVQSIYIGLFANEVLPLRTGEVIRWYLLAHWNNLHLSLVVASGFIERMIDGFWMVGTFAITAGLLKELPKTLTDAVRILTALMAAGALLFGYVLIHKQHAHSIVRESRWASTLRHLIEGLHSMGRFKSLSVTVLLSLLYVVIQVLAVWCLMRAYLLDLNLGQAAAVLTVVRLATVVPNAPGNLGLFQASTLLALTHLEVGRQDATDFSFVMFAIWTLPLLLGGALAVALSGLNLQEIRLRARSRLDATKTP
ncbi:MAG: lysylphosphatidylglycerol synthase transmembrane domain-containing protein [Bryobacteraceae bacterium]